VPASLKPYIAETGPLARFWSLLQAASVATQEDGCFGIAKGAAYSSLLAFFPVLTTLAALLVQANAEAVARTVAGLLYDVIPPGTEEIVRALFTVQGQRPSSLLIAAILLSAWAGSGVMMSLMEGFRSVYRIPSGRSLLHERAVAMLLVFGAALPGLGASTLIVFNDRVQRWAISWMGLASGDFNLRGWLQLAGQALSEGIAVSAMVIITAVVYYFGPNRKQTFRCVWPGAVLATALWLLSTLAFGWYVRHVTNYNLLYGGVGAGLALLVWMYVWSVIALFGCEFNAVRERWLSTSI
jgi:membrane protein